jgi:hypothetical protein
MCPTWALMVASDRYARAAISKFDQPQASSTRTSRSRSVSAGQEVVAGSGPVLGCRRVWQVRAESVQQPARHAGGHDRITGGNRTDRGDQLGGFNEL